MSNTLKARYLSLDVLRGLDVALMIVVNTPGSWSTTYSPLLHADWHGFTLTDLVFPTFLFVVGNAMSFAIPKYMEKGTSYFIQKAFKRAILIFLIGFLLYWFPFFQDGALKPFSETRIFGVLQRIALCYLFGALILFFCKSKRLLLISILILLLYDVVLLLFGNLTLSGNAVLQLDLWLMGEKHMYGGEGIAFDPEGLLSTLPAIVNVLAGYMAGRFLQQKGQNFETVAKLMLVGAVLITTAFAWDLWMPINKKLWTSSFVLLTTGIDLMLIAVLVYVLDMRSITRWAYPFEAFGKNPLFIYVLSILLVNVLLLVQVNGQSVYSWLYQNVFSNTFGPYLGSFLFAVSYTTICWLVAYIMDKKKVYVKV